MGKLKNILNKHISSLSVNELKELENSLSVELRKVRSGIIDDDSVPGYEPKELEELLSEKLRKVSNRITAINLRGGG